MRIFFSRFQNVFISNHFQATSYWNFEAIIEYYNKFQSKTPLGTWRSCHKAIVWSTCGSDWRLWCVCSVHCRAVPEAPGAAGSDAETAAGAEPAAAAETAATGQQPESSHHHTHTGQYDARHRDSCRRASIGSVLSRLATLVQFNMSLISSQALVSKTLDQASAQFAASALITTDQLLGFKSKEELVLPTGVNGVLTGAGEFPVVGNLVFLQSEKWKLVLGEKLFLPETERILFTQLGSSCSTMPGPLVVLTLPGKKWRTTVTNKQI